jgi:D-3-phosphoglycerate dehydrogenase
VSPSPVALITARVDRRLLEQRLAGWDVRTPREPDGEYLPMSEQQLTKLLAGCTAWVTEIDSATASLLCALPSLKLIVSCRGNPVNVDLAAARRAGITVCSVPGRNADATADLAVGLMLCTIRHIATADRWIRDGMWTGPANLVPYTRFLSYDLNGKSIALLGFGAVGQRVGRRCVAFGMNVAYYDPNVDADEPWAQRRTSIDMAIRDADVISLHAAVTADTKSMIGRRQFEMMKDGCVFINAARAALVDRDALLWALETGKVARAGLDVFWDEPLVRADRLFEYADRLVLTPHIGGASRDVVHNHTQVAVDCLNAFLAEMPLPTPVVMAGMNLKE